MRLFNEREKRIIRQLVEGSSVTEMYLPINVFDDIFNGRNVGFFGEGTMELVFPYNAKGEPSIEDTIPIYNEILERVLLIDYLDKEGLVYIVPTSTSVNKLTRIGNVSKLNRITMLIDPTIGEILLRCMNRPLYVSETLIDYVRNGFKSLEEQAFDESKKQTRYSSIAIFLAMITIIISLFQSCCSTYYTRCDSNDTATLEIPINAMLNYMQNDLDLKLNTTMNNTVEINAKLRDSVIVKNPCKCTPKNKYSKVKKDECVNYMRVNTCQDTVINKRDVIKE